jgi:hypothetical protein
LLRLSCPPRDLHLGTAQLDLTDHYTGLLTCLFHPTQDDFVFDDTLERLPSGTTTFSNVLFDVRGVIVLRKQEPHWDFLRRCWDRYPQAVEGIRVARPCRRVHVLHGATDGLLGGGSARGLNLVDGMRLGCYRLHYADGRQHELPIVYGQDLRNWWTDRRLPEPAATSAHLAWTGANCVSEFYGATLRLYLRTYDNPQPDLAVSHLDFVSDLTIAAPFLIAVTVE